MTEDEQQAGEAAAGRAAPQTGLEDEPAAWEQQPGEPAKWYGCFLAYLQLGPTRTHSGLRRSLALESGQPLPAAKVSQSWRTAAQRWRWTARARAWDIHQREQLGVSVRAVSLALHERRIEVIEETIEQVREVLDAARLAEADEEQARAWLPQMRLFLRDLLVAERQEFEHLMGEKEQAGLAISADDLRAAQRRLAQETAAQPSASASSGAAEDAGVSTVHAPSRRRMLLVCVGADGDLLIDLAALRAVRSATGLAFQRLIAPTRRKFAEYLRRERGLGRPVELLHLALHVAPEGVAFSDGLADGNWLSERLSGVNVMLLAGCSGESVGDWLGVVPHVVTLGEEISHEDAAALTQYFWQGIGLGEEPGAALDAALGHCPPAVAEYVVRHW